MPARSAEQASASVPSPAFRRRAWILPSVVLALAGAAARAQQAPAAGPSGALTIVPVASATEMLTDNYQPGFGTPQSDSITSLSGGLRLRGRSRRFDGFVSYDLTGIAYARHGSSNSAQQSLQAQVKSEVIDNHGYVDLSASIARQAVSPFATQTYDPALANANTTEVRTLQIAPSLRGQVAGLWTYDARLGAALQRSGQGGIGDTDTRQASVQLNRAQQGRLRWSLQAQRSITRFPGQPATNDSRINATVYYAVPEADLELLASAGHERSNITTAITEGGATGGLGATWTPSPRTRLDARFDHRQFGSTYSVDLEFRSARSVWHFTSGRQVSSINSNTGTTFFDLLYAMFASVEPDPGKRTQLVSNYLQANGINAGAMVQGGFLTQATTISNQQALSFALQGVRSGVTLTATLGDQWQANPSLQAGAALANAQHVYTKGLSANLFHRLTPDSTLNLIAALTDNSGSLGATAAARLSTLSLAWTSVLSRYVSVSATLRHSVSAGGTGLDYHENAAIAALSLRY